MKRYQLIKFLSEPKDEATLLSIDRIPRRWVRYDVESGHVLTKFPPPPYTTQTHKLLTLLIETEGDPMPSWPEYPIELVGHADTYEDSMKRLVILEKEPYAFTSDSDTTPSTKAAQILEELKTQSLATIMEVPSIGDQESDKLDSSIEVQSDSQMSSDESVSWCKKIQNVKSKIKQKKKVNTKTRQQKVIKNRSKSRSLISRSSLNTKVDIESASFVQELECDHNSMKGAKVHGNVKQNMQKKKVTKPRSGDSGRSVSVSPVDINIDIEGAYFVQESEELVSEKIAIDSAPVLSAPKTQAVSFLHKSIAFDESLKKATQTVQQTEKEYSKDTIILLSTLKGLSIDLKENTNAINNLCAMIQDNKICNIQDNTQKALVVDSDFNLPFESLQQFKEFDIRLQQDEKFRQRCAASLIFYIDPENHVPKSVTNIIKKFISRDVAMNYTAVKQMVKKEVFKNMKFCDIMFEVLTKHHTDNQGNPICAKYFFQCLGHALANSKDWDGFRVERAKKEMTKKRLAEGQTTKN